MPKINSIENLRARIAEIEAQHTPFNRLEGTQMRSKGAKEQIHAANECSEMELEKKAWAKVLRSASVREQSTKRLRGKLGQAGFTEAVINKVLDRAVSSGVVDDRRYSDALVRATIAQGKGLEIIRREIEELGISLDELQAVQDYRESEGADEESRAISILERFPPTAKNKREAAFRKLLNKGFSVSVAASAARAWHEMHR